jgi:hypothetical protein
MLTPGKIYKTIRGGHGLSLQPSGLEIIGWLGPGKLFLLLETKKVLKEGWSEYIWVKVILCREPLMGWALVHAEEVGEVPC